MNPALLVTGARGQLGRTIEGLWQEGPLAADTPLLLTGRREMDLTDGAMVEDVLRTLKPGTVINAAAYTAVDRAETENARARAVNETGVANLARACRRHGCRLVHISTGFVFDGRARRPYLPSDRPAPLGAYGRSKLAGERQLLKILPDAGTIVRVTWLYSACGGNFVTTMLRLMSERDRLEVVSDQTGSPASARSLAGFLFAVARDPAMGGVYHWSDGGGVSRIGFARAIQKAGLARGLLDRKIPIRPVASADYPAPAPRPAFNVLDRRRALAAFPGGREGWRECLDRTVAELAAGEGEEARER